MEVVVNLRAKEVHKCFRTLQFFEETIIGCYCEPFESNIYRQILSTKLPSEFSVLYYLPFCRPDIISYVFRMYRVNFSLQFSSVSYSLYSVPLNSLQMIC
jgi:hypothetical protein